MNVQPYLFFDGRCEEALDFYQKVVGAKVEMMMRFKDNPEPMQGGDGCGAGMDSKVMDPAAMADKIMHASVRIGDATVLASDGMAQGKPAFQGFALAVSAPSEAEADKIFNALAEGGQVQMPMAATFFAPRFGMTADRFGVSWMVMADRPS